MIGVSQLTQIISVQQWFDAKRNAVMLHEAVHFACTGVWYLHTLDHVTRQRMILDRRIDFNLATVFCGRNINFRKKYYTKEASVTRGVFQTRISRQLYLRLCSAFIFFISLLRSSQSDYLKQFLKGTLTFFIKNYLHSLFHLR